MSKPFDPHRLDVKRFAEQAGRLESSEAVAAYPRLMAETQGRGRDNRVEWQARGELRNPSHLQPGVWLFLHAATRLELVCQRCLQPVAVDVAVDRTFRFVPDEATAAQQDEHCEEDVLAESRSFDLAQLVEDELLMDLPLAPRHDACPVTLPTSAGEEELAAVQEVRENPFEILGRLKAPKH
ncbi:MAG: DUF177 domain-containing protein [Burkholderiales bacterium]|nr:DUF177 domain-containing protein [Burkholderiales bacterium]